MFEAAGRGYPFAGRAHDRTVTRLSVAPTALMMPGWKTC